MLLSEQVQLKEQSQVRGTGVMLRCPRCFESVGFLPEKDAASIECFSCGSRLACEQGIWKTLLPERAARYSQFVQDYESIRAAEGRGSNSDEYYLALPYRDLSGRLSGQWALRARTFRYIERKVMPRFTPLAHYRLRILDLGAGNGWMSYRFAIQGHTPVAVDLLINERDGLGAAKHYEPRLPSLFPRFQAELDNLPFADSQFDVVMFNASFHYSENYEKTLAEAIRCVRGGGTVVIADTPWYSDERSGERMLQERRALFIRRYGFPSDELNSLEFLTDQRLSALEQRFHTQWHTHGPFYGVRWHMRPLAARLRGARKPSRFRIYTAKVAK
jgi:SAM-dependent methyltransferase